MKKVIFTILISFATLCFFNTASAALNIEAEVDVPASCIVTDNNGIIHTYPQTDSYLAICAIEKALEQNTISNIDFADFGFGLFINSVNNISQDNTYWQLRLNNISASVGVSDLVLQAGNTISLILTAFDPVTFAETSLDDQVTLHINSLSTPPEPEPAPEPEPEPAPEPEPEPEPVVTPEPIHHSSGGYIMRQNVVNPPVKPTFDLQKAFDFLSSQQKEKGSFGEDLYTDWATLALATGNFQDQKTKLIKYLEENKIKNLSLTDYERHAMALMAFGLNPYNVNDVNYIEKIITSFDGKQFGDINEDNDDIFALIVLQNAGYGIDDKIINDDIAFVLKAQNTDGSWDNSVDMTGAAIEALAGLAGENFLLRGVSQADEPRGSADIATSDSDPEKEEFSPARINKELFSTINKAREFLKQNQKEDGGWGNASSTAWAIEGILALGEKIEDWKKGENTPLDYLATIQDTDGGIKSENINNRIWETSYVISALSSKTWNQIMQKFEKQKALVVLKEQSLPARNATQSVASEKNPQKTVLKKSKPKLINQINATATAINSVTVSPSVPTQTEQKEVPQKNWFVKLLDSIFSIF